jgi:rod shape-determining protein MreD
MFAELAKSPWVRVPLVVVVVLALQLSLSPDFRPFGVAPDLMLLLAVCGGLVAGSERGAVAGFGIGIAFDLVLQTPFGLSALVYSLAAFGLGYLRLGVERSGWWMKIVAVFVASVAAVLAYAVLGSLFGMTRIVNLRLLKIALVVAAINALLAPVAIPVMRWALMGKAGRPARL